MRQSLRWFILALVSVFASESPIARAGESVIRLKAGEEEMKTAIADARKSLPIFWTALASPAANQERFSLKVMMPYSSIDVEHLWVTNIERRGQWIYGTVNNEPKYVTYVRFGQRVEFSEEQISDWTYRQDGKIVGNFTMRPLLSHMPAEQAEQYRALLANP